jgi:hypothetical protein
MSDSESAEQPQSRPRPQYGEYASPEEQRAAIKKPEPWQLEHHVEQQDDEQTDALRTPPAPQSYYPGQQQYPGQQNYPGLPPYEQGRPAPTSGARPGAGDRVATFVLLAFCLYNVISMAVTALSGGATIRSQADALGPDGATFADMPSWVWTAIAVEYGIVWIVALVASLASLRAGRRTFWIPLVAGIVAGFVGVALMLIALGQNPDLLPSVPTPGQNT